LIPLRQLTILYRRADNFRARSGFVGIEVGGDEMRKASLLLVALALIAGSALVPKANAGVVVGVGVGAPVYVPPLAAYGYVPGPYFVAGYAPGAYYAPRYARSFAAYGPAPVYRHVYLAPRRFAYGRYYGRQFVGRRELHGYRR
jgi:hypothetical protein